MNLEELCRKPIVSVDVEDSIVAAAREMREHHVGDVIVYTRASMRPVGILTDRDIVVSLAARGVDLDDVRVRDVMSSSLVVAQHDEDVMEALERMAEFGVRRLPVLVDDEICVGLLSFDDVVDYVGRETELLTRVVARQLDRESRERR